jgi:hypothetical protein
MESATASTLAQTVVYRCRFCEQRIGPGTGVLAAPRLSPQQQSPDPSQRLFGKPERFHVLCVPASYRLDERF